VQPTMEDPRTLMSEEEVEHGVESGKSAQRFRRGWAATAAGVLLVGALVLGLAEAGGGLRSSSLHGTSELYMARTKGDKDGKLTKAMLKGLPKVVTIEGRYRTHWGSRLAHNYDKTVFSPEDHKAGASQKWTLSAVGDGRVYISANNGKYLADDDGRTSMSHNKQGYEQWFLSDADAKAKTFYITSWWGKRLSNHRDNLDTTNEYAGRTEEWTITVVP
jgi:hypothetical protein